MVSKTSKKEDSFVGMFPGLVRLSICLVQYVDEEVYVALME